jgi:general secretion pathway protein C
MRIVIAGSIEWLVAAAAAISLGAAAGPVAWRAMGVVEGPTSLPAGAVAAATPGAVQPPAFDALRLGALFGEPAAPPPASGTEIAATTLQLTLLGVTLAEPSELSRAIIAGGDRPVASYAPGAPVTASVRLAEVRADRVLLVVDGRTEALFFPDRSTAAPGAAAPGAVPAGFGGVVPIASAGPPSRDPDTVIAWYRAEIDRSPQAVMERLGVAAMPDGYRILESAPPEVRQAGFRPGDLVSRVNGQAVGDVTADRQRLDEIVAAGRATLELQRDGETIRMTFPLR